MPPQSSMVVSPTYATDRPLVLGRTLLIYALALLLAGWGFEVWQIRSDRAAALQATRDDLATMASSLTNELSAMIYDGVGAAMAAANELSARAGETPTRTQQSQTLGNMLTGGDYVREVFIATPASYVAAARVEPNSGAQGAPAWSTELFTHQTAESFVGPPARTQDDADAVIPIAHRVAPLRGEPRWAGALFALESLHRLYSRLPTQSAGLLLVSTDGIVLMRTPSNPDDHFVGRSIANSEPFGEARDSPHPLTILEGRNALTGVPRLFAVAKVPNYPILAAAGRDIDVALRPWWDRTLRSIQAAAVSSLAWMLLTIGLYAVLRRHYNSLCRSEERFELITQASNDGVWDWDAHSNRIYYSSRLKENLGHAPDDEFPAVPDTLMRLVHPDDLERTRLTMRRHLLDRAPYDLEQRLRMRNGEYRWFKARGQAVWNESGRATRMAGSLSDIHERKLAEQSLQHAQLRELRAREEFAQHLLRVQEQERQRLADELHDRVGQDLSLIGNRAQLILQQPNLSRAITDQLRGLADLAAAVIGEVRAVVHNLRPLHVEQLGLTDALHSLLDQATATSGLAIERRLEDVDDVLNRSAATHLYRIVQDALDNVVRQAGARNCRVWIERDLHCLRLTIANDGTGRNISIGLAGINERVRMLAASCQIAEQEPGTRIVIEIPISESLASRQHEPSPP